MHSSCGLLRSCTPWPLHLFSFFCLAVILQTLSGEAKLAATVNPLPLQRVNCVNVGQTRKELKQLLLNHPVKVIFTLLLSRCLWVPLLKNCGYYTLVGLGFLLRIALFPFEFVFGKLLKALRRKIEVYLLETLDLILTPLGYLRTFCPLVRVPH